ncbi:MAG TPA: chemotaxis protein CheD [Desulfurivibrionaceae bacterium]|nr:chemotaxis protein CheD [Desulfurivibrionaceae bacterium]
MNTLRVVGIGEWQVSREPGDLLRTYALGSCVALVLQHPSTLTTGLVHILLPDSVNQAGGRQKSPGYYADTAVPLLLRMVREVAGIFFPGNTGVMAKLVGGATVWSKDSQFQVGKRNIEAVERLLRQQQIPLVAQDTGGTPSRTVTVDVATGAVVVKWAPGSKEVQL